MVRILFLADVVGRPGRRAVRAQLPLLRAEYKPDLVIVNGENAAGGLGIDFGTAKELFGAGTDVMTTGNHVWNKKEANELVEVERRRLLRPLNFAPGAPGVGVCEWSTPGGARVVVMNVMGRIFMTDLLDCPFRAADTVLDALPSPRPIVFIDFHGEATSEKIAFAYHVDGRATVVVGTHTHVQTADERILPGGTGYISDVGMCGPSDGVIGVDAPSVVQRFLTGRPMRFDVAEGPTMVNGVVADCDEATGRAVRLERIIRHSKDDVPTGS